MSDETKKVLEEIKEEIMEYAKNPNAGDFSLGAGMGAMKAVEIINNRLEDQA